MHEPATFPQTRGKPIRTQRQTGRQWRSPIGISGWWRIIEMTAWDREAIELIGPAFIEFHGQGGRFQSLRLGAGWAAGTRSEAVGPGSTLPGKAMTSAIPRAAAAGRSF